METELSRKLKHCRRIQNLSQEGLAEASGISVRTIQRIEKGESVGSAYTLNTLANALHINPSDLVFEEVIPPAADNSGNIGQLKLLNPNNNVEGRFVHYLEITVNFTVQKHIFTKQ